MHVTTWKSTENILSERNHTEKATQITLILYTIHEDF